MKQIVRLLIWGGGAGDPEHPAINVHATLQGALDMARQWLGPECGGAVTQEEIERVVRLLRAGAEASEIKGTKDSWMLIEAHEVEA